jgi:hypothetical protein
LSASHDASTQATIVHTFFAQHLQAPFQNLIPASQAPWRPHWPSGRNTPSATRVYAAIEARMVALQTSLTSLPMAFGEVRPVDGWPLLGLHGAKVGFLLLGRIRGAVGERWIIGMVRYGASWVPKRKGRNNFVIDWFYGVPFPGARSVVF